MIEYSIPEHIHHAATKSGLRLKAALDEVQDTLHIHVLPLLSGERLLRVDITKFDPSERSDGLFEAAVFEGEKANRERLGLNRPAHLRRN